MARSRSTGRVTGLIVGCVPLVILSALALLLIPIVYCPACIGWRTNDYFIWSGSGAHRGDRCLYCKSTGKVTLIRDWILKRKESRPCYYMTHDE